MKSRPDACFSAMPIGRASKYGAKTRSVSIAMPLDCIFPHAQVVVCLGIGAFPETVYGLMAILEAFNMIPSTFAPPLLEGTVYTEFMAYICEARSISNYFEVGVAFGESMSSIKCDRAVGVDPDFALQFNIMKGKRDLRLFQMTSDVFFARHDLTSLFNGSVDVAFLDGLHLFEFLLRDFRNAERHCAPNSIIFLHDCLPFTPEMTVRDPKLPKFDPPPFNAMWTGDVWKVGPILKKYRPDLRVTYFDCPPTGLVSVTNLDPSSTVLSDRYAEIMDEFSQLKCTTDVIRRLHDKSSVKSSRDLQRDNAWGRFFDI